MAVMHKIIIMAFLTVSQAQCKHLTVYSLGLIDGLASHLL